jgi:hypothetical protein
VLDTILRGQKLSLEYHFTNTGNADLDIELVSACKCSELDWPRDLIRPGERGIIRVYYDSTTEPLGKLEKTIDIIANTDPIVVEAKFSVTIIEEE